MGQLWGLPLRLPFRCSDIMCDLSVLVCLAKPERLLKSLICCWLFCGWPVGRALSDTLVLRKIQTLNWIELGTGQGQCFVKSRLFSYLTGSASHGSSFKVWMCFSRCILNHIDAKTSKCEKLGLSALQTQLCSYYWLNDENLNHHL